MEELLSSFSICYKLTEAIAKLIMARKFLFHTGNEADDSAIVVGGVTSAGVVLILVVVIAATAAAIWRYRRGRWGCRE